MSCEQMGHSGAEDHHIQPKFRCLYCGSWGYTTKWYDGDNKSYEDCSCEGPIEDHWRNCDEA